MSYLLFLDESGHDHKNMPFEVRGGVALSIRKLFSFIQGWRRLEEDCFGALLSSYGKEAKGHKLLDKDRYKWALQGPIMSSAERRKFARAFLEKGRDKQPQNKQNFTAYGQASIEMARGVFDLLAGHDAKLFASMIPRGTKPPADFSRNDLLRKDHVFLLERYYHFLMPMSEHGLIVMDETDKILDRKFVQNLQNYFERTETGRTRASYIVPSPLFVSSDMSYAIQAADICIYCVNWGYRDQQSSRAEVRSDIQREFGPKVANLQWKGTIAKNSRMYPSNGIIVVPDPYVGR